jgi:Flp pilus assembly pilin Flp
MSDIRVLKILLDGRVAKARRSERGASAIEWVIISAIVLTICITVGGILLSKLQTKTNSINLDTP